MEIFGNYIKSASVSKYATLYKIPDNYGGVYVTYTHIMYNVQRVCLCVLHRANVSHREKATVRGIETVRCARGGIR